MELKRILENYLFGDIKAKVIPGNSWHFRRRRFEILVNVLSIENDVSVCFINATHFWVSPYSVVHFIFTRGTYAIDHPITPERTTWKVFSFLLQKSYLQRDQGDWNHCKELRKSRFILCFHIPGAGIHIHRSKQNGLDATFYDATMSRGNLFYGNSRMRGMPPG